jgi:hypothetical protein
MGAATDYDHCIARLTTTGTLDPTWGAGGWYFGQGQPGANGEGISSLLIQPDGMVIAGASCVFGASCLIRLRSDGTTDTSFDGDGKVEPTSDGGHWRSSIPVVEAADGRYQMVTHRWGGLEVFQLDTGGTFDQYLNGTRDWDSGAGDAHGHFGICLSSTTAATPVWPTAAGCPAVDGAAWRSVSTTPDTIATANALSDTSTASLHFGMRVAADIKPGRYAAPIRFSVIAP